MKETFLYTLHAILPILLIILCGFVTRRVGMWSDEFYAQLNKLCFRLFLPIMLFYNVYSIQDLSAMNWRVIGYAFFGVLFSALLGAVAARLFIHQYDQKGVIIQVAFRSNQAVLGLALANSLGGQAAMSFASLSTALFVPLFNILAVIALVIYGSGEAKKPTPASLLRQIARNPLIIGALSGLVLVIVRQLLPVVDGQPIFTIQNQLPSLYGAISKLSAVASPIMLFVLGTRLDLGAVRSILPQLSLGIFLRLILSPVLVIGGAVALQSALTLTGTEMPTLVSMFSTPVAVSSAVMAQELGGDDQLASQLVVWTSIFSLLTIFCIVYTLRSFGLL